MKKVRINRFIIFLAFCWVCLIIILCFYSKNYASNHGGHLLPYHTQTTFWDSSQEISEGRQRATDWGYEWHEEGIDRNTCVLDTSPLISLNNVWIISDVDSVMITGKVKKVVVPKGSEVIYR